MKRSVMVRAWEIAKAAAVKFGGKTREYFAESLRKAWAETKSATITLSGTKVVVIADEVTHKITSIMAIVDGRIAQTYGPCETKVAYMDAYRSAVNTHVGYGNMAEMYIRRASGILTFDSVQEITKRAK
ncbi:hypothetical protein [Paenibacillus sp. YN15]|uniref:hypothetical protein n=1 Tax=Paenibacillus sp. YN15 TaxID=1742774 RepID=UPI000DCD1DEE|nr:hypothetical protein [Paenibacillus sp. YN15]RAU96782.1 hypothetical protein DQG13_19680 [Paenibacillus sp. YN15]